MLKGSLDSVYAVRDFFQIDPELVSPLVNVDLVGLVEQGLVRLGEVDDMEALVGMSTTAAAERALGRGEALLMALLKNLQTALVDSSEGSASGAGTGQRMGRADAHRFRDGDPVEFRLV